MVGTMVHCCHRHGNSSCRIISNKPL